MNDAFELQDVLDFIGSGAIRILFFSRPSCGVCIAVKPKVEELLENFPKAEAIYINLDRVPEASGQFSVYALPGILLYVNGKESGRIARYFSMEDLHKPLKRYYDLMYN
ncbi:MAG: thioredoxin family protein [Spirochaetales bacterium]|mgnify:CR=1 FL=1|nr:thioredoxin family protein [Spirochaetales bacterium]